MDFWFQWLALVSIFGVAVIAPGPDFVVAVRTSLLYSRKAGLWTALGFALGVGIHVTYTIVGFAAVISQSVLMFSIIKYAGAAYLLYMGWKALRSQGSSESMMDISAVSSQQTMSARKALLSGFLTNALNPKATLFFLAMFSQFLTPETPLNVQVFFGATCMIMVWAWFSFVAMGLTVPKIRATFLRFSKWIDRICGGLFIALGVRLALSRGVVTP